MAIIAPQSSTGRKKSGVSIKPPKATDPSILKQIGSVGLSGLHTVGSLLSAPSRTIWGSANAAAGGEGGFGNLDPWDMTGGIQASDFLANQGVIAKNDPTQWEWMDPVRGAIDLAGDPTTYLGLGGLTKAGIAASKAGGAGLSKGIAQQVARGERGLVSVGLPFRPTAGAFGTGERAAKIAGKVADVGTKIRYSGPVRQLAKRFDYRVKGQAAELNQRANLKVTENQTKQLYQNRLKAVGLARDIVKAGLTGDDVRAIGENIVRAGKATPVPPTVADLIKQIDPGAERGALVSIRDIRKAGEAAGVPREELNAMLQQGAKGGWLSLHRHDSRASLSQAQIDEMLDLGRPAGFTGKSGEDNLFVGAALRQGAEHPTSAGKTVSQDIEAASQYDPAIVEKVREFRDYANSLRQEALFRGTVRKGELDDEIEFMARFARPDVLESMNAGRKKIWEQTGSSAPYRAVTARDVGRMWYLKGDKRGTEGLTSVITDPDIEKAIAANEAVPAATRKTQKQMADEVEKIITEKHGAFLAKDDVVVRNGKEIVRNRHQKLAQILVNSPELRAQGLWGNHPVTDMLNYMSDLSDRHLAGMGFYDLVGDMKLTPPKLNRRGQRLIARGSVDDPNTIPLGRVLKERGFTKKNDRMEKALQEIWARKNPGKALTPKQWKKERKMLLNSGVSRKDYNEVIYEGALTPTSPRGLMDSVNALFKASVLSRPARVVRDFFSAVINNVQGGNFSGRTFMDAQRAVRGQPFSDVSRYLANPVVAAHLAERGIDPADADAATKGIMELFAAARSTSNPMASELLNQGQGAQMVGDIREFVEQVPGALRQPQSLAADVAGGLSNFGRTFVGQAQDPATGTWAFDRGNLNPLGVAGVGSRKETTFGPARAYEAPLQASDTLTRAQPWLERISRGEDPMQAMAEVNRAQVNYDPRTFTPTETQIRRLLPFYSFFSRQLPYLATELLKRPGGGHGTTIKAIASAGEEDPLAPAHIANTASIPIPGNRPDGSKQYLTGLGLMMEDPLQFGNLLKGDLSGTAQEILSRTGPVIKTPIEMATGESLFQQGFSGGRELSQMDPGAGRVLSNLGHWTGLRDQAQGPVRLPGDPLTELAIGNSPLAGPLSIARQATDTRTGLGTKATNLLLGAKVSTVSREAQQAALREKAQILAKGLGAKEYAKIYFPPELLDTLRKSDPIRAAQADAINSLLKELASNARGQAAARAKAKKGSKL